MSSLSATEEVADSSQQFVRRIGESVGFAEEGRFFGDGIVILDRFGPYLRFFSLDGRLRWTGGRQGGGPDELDKPHAIAAGPDSTLLVLQRGRISQWRMSADSLAFGRVLPLPPHYLPLGVVSDCETDWLFYARDDAMFDTTTWQVQLGPEVGWLHSLRLTDTTPVIRPLWKEQRDPNTIAVSGHSAVLIGRSDEQVVVLHRAGAWRAGKILEFNCQGQLLRSQSELPLITGDSLPVLLPRPKPLQWTAGVAALGNGWLLALHRHLSPRFYDVPERVVKTEVILFENGRFQGSTVVDGAWIILDYHPTRGVLMATTQPVPHFIRVPLSVLEPGGEQSR